MIDLIDRKVLTQYMVDHFTADWSFNDLIDAIGKVPLEKSGKWIPVEERLPENGINPVTKDAYVYPVTVEIGKVRDVRYYSFWNGHWYNQGPAKADDLVIAWRPRPVPFNPQN